MDYINYRTATFHISWFMGVWVLFLRRDAEGLNELLDEAEAYVKDLQQDVIDMRDSQDYDRGRNCSC